MNETKALTVEDARRALEIDAKVGHPHNEARLPASIDALIRAVQVEMPCYRRFHNINAKTCLERWAPLWPICPSCAAREGR